jgi:hypothetical protein
MPMRERVKRYATVGSLSRHFRRHVSQEMGKQIDCRILRHQADAPNAFTESRREVPRHCHDVPADAAADGDSAREGSTQTRS